MLGTDFGLVPPEIQSALVYAGPGPGPLLATAAAWDGLAAELEAASASYATLISELTADIAAALREYAALRDAEIILDRR